ncbi:MAG: two-component system activity regulator YycH [Marinisporobacter sp.]|jgi:regulatory protein YycH of two-component signal transduction system YycFG|nr:two-component system activity regulator YycH [Marinisporobacter sp.]
MRRIGKENFKTILLTMLFVLSIALNQQLWERISLTKIIPSIRQAETIEVRSQGNIDNISNILSPQSFCINFGGGLHTLIYSDSHGIWKGTIETIRDQISKKDLKVELIDEALWEEARAFRSIEMKFGYTMSAKLLKEIVKEKELIDEVEAFDSILISSKDDTSIYISNQREGVYYLVKGTKSNNQLLNIIKNIEENGYDAYYAMQEIYPVENERIMPIEFNENIHEVKVVQEIDPTNDGTIESFAGTFFGENLDFVRKIRETSGSVIYMYGYGQKELKIDDLGVLYYIEKTDPQKSSQNISSEDALNIALQFINEHGSWSNVDIYLKNIEFTQKNRYIFSFGYRINGLPVYYKTDDKQKMMDAAVQVEVLGEQVIYYKRFLKREKIAIKLLEDEENRTVLSAPQIIDRNFGFIKEDFLRTIDQEQNIDQEEISKKVLSTIRKVEVGYYNQPSKQPNQLTPIWIIKTDQMIYYFDAYNGRMINRSQI